MSHLPSFATVALLLVSLPTQAGNTELARIMQGLDRQMQAISHDIAMEDWPAVARDAGKIAQHAHLSAAEHQRIADRLGTLAEHFEHHDHRTHQAAESLAKTAAKGEGKAIISSFQALQMSCLECHQATRKALSGSARKAP